jgi:diguanylate cyclase
MLNLGGMDTTIRHAGAHLDGIGSEAGDRNAYAASVWEGLVVPWVDTLCKRCLKRDRQVVSTVSEVWGGPQAAAALGIETYASAPICASNGEILDTLCVEALKNC